MRSSTFLVIAAAIPLLAACATDVAPTAGRTGTPPPTLTGTPASTATPELTSTPDLTATPNPTPTATVTLSTTANPTDTATTTLPPQPTPTAAGVVEVTIGTPEGNETLFVPDEASVPSGAEVRLTFENSTTTAHNLTFGPPINAGTEPFVEPDASDTFAFTAPQPGSYEFICTLHPWMTGELEVTAAP